MTDYQKLSLDDLGYLGRGKSKHRPRNDPTLYGGDYPFIQTGNVKAANLHVREYAETYNETGLAQSKLWDKGTLLITIAANIAETAILDIKACFPDSIVGFIPDESKVNSYFVKYYIDYIKREMQSISQGTTQDNLSLDKIRTFKLRIPEKKIVDEITDVLLTYDNLIENNNRRIAILEEMAQSLYREWFVKFRFPGHDQSSGQTIGTAESDPEGASAKDGASQNTKFIDSSLGTIPEGWNVVQIKNIGKVITGKTPSKRKGEYYSSQDVPFLKTPDMHGSIFVTDIEDWLSKEGADSQDNKYIPRDSVCVACIGAKAGVASLIPATVQTNQQINSVVLNATKMREYFYLFASRMTDLIRALGSSGATMTNVSKGKFESIEIIKPEESVLDKFHELTSPCFNMILNLQKKNTILKKQRGFLLPKLISGRISL